VDAVLASRLTHSFALVNPLYNEKPFPIWSGGMAYPRLFKATGLTRIEDVQFIETRSGRVLWRGEAEYGIDRTVKKWKSPTNLVQKSLSETLNRLVNHLSEFVFSPKEKPSSPDGPKDLPRP
jgi:hypothetical protein